MELGLELSMELGMGRLPKYLSRLQALSLVG